MGATHSVDNGGAAIELAKELTRGVGADVAIVTVDVVSRAGCPGGGDVDPQGRRPWS